jgi:hypothetical protein
MRPITLALVLASPFLLRGLGVGLARAEDPAPAPSAVSAIVEGLSHADPDRRLEAARAARGEQDRALTPLLVKGLEDEAENVRLAAAQALATRTDERERKRAAAALGRRLGRLAGGVVRAERGTVIQALHDLAHPDGIAALLDLPAEVDRNELRARLLAVANVPDPKAMAGLIDYGARGRRRHVHLDLVRDAVQYATGEVVRGDIDQIRSWWKEFGANFDYAAARATRAERRAREEAREDRRRERERRDGRERREDGGGRGEGGEGGQEGDG